MHLRVSFFVTLALCLSFYFIAGNIGSGWIYLLSTSLLAALGLGFVLPLIELAVIRAYQNTPQHCIAGQSVTVKLSLQKASLWPSLIPIQWLTLSYKLPLNSQEGDSRCLRPYHVECLDRDQCWLWTTLPLIRGVHPLGQIVLTTSFPFGLAVWVKEVAAPGNCTIVVYPKVVPIEGFIFFRLRAGAVGQSGFSRSTQAVRQSTSTRGLREYIRGDSPRHVHWASSARAGRLLVREFEAEGLPCFDVLLDLAALWTSSDQFELAVTSASSLLSLGHKLGMGTELILNPDISELSLNLPPVIPGFELQMEILARVQPSTCKSNADAHQITDSRHNQERILLAIVPTGSITHFSPACYLIEIVDCSLPANDLDSTSLESSSSTGLMRSTISTEEDLQAL